MHQEEWEYIQFATPQRLEKELHSLEGILKGIAIDDKINTGEIKALLGWCERHKLVSQKSPFNEIIPAIQMAVEDGVLEEEEKEDIKWLCQKYRTPNKYYNSITSDMQRLQGILAGIVADGEITEEELIGLKKWLSNHEHLRTVWPFDEIDSLITEIMSDGIIDEQEHHILTSFCNQFLADKTSMVIDLPIGGELLRTGVCSAMPTLNFEKKSFCLTGKFENGTKNDIAKIISDLGGKIYKSVRKDIDYLIIGGKGSECWAFACYGRKVESVMNHRKNGLPIQVVHEFDLWDAAEDLMY